MSLAPHRHRVPRLFLVVMVLFLEARLSVPSLARDVAAPAVAPAEKKTDKKTDEDEVPAPEELSLKTEDGLQMVATFFPGTKGKESIPVILIHGLKESREVFTQEQGLASYLQEKLGCAVIAPDLRGHGGSTTVKGSKQKLKADKLTPKQFHAMVTEDLREAKNFLWKKNNEGKLNLDKLVVVGVDLGASLALNFAAYDAVGYEHQQAAYGPLKLGRFVKGVVLISPVGNHAGLDTPKVMSSSYIRNELPVMLTVGNKAPLRLAETQKFYSLFSKRPPAADSKPQSQTVWYASKLETTLQGAKLLSEPSMGVPDKITKFITARLITNEDAKSFVWKERKLPHE